MFRSNYFVNFRVIPANRSYCQSKSKWYIVKHKEDPKKPANDSQIVKKFREHETEVASSLKYWERFVGTVRPPLLQAHHDAVDLIKKMEIQKKIFELKNKQMTMITEKIQDPETRKMIVETSTSIVTSAKDTSSQLARQAVKYQKLAAVEVVRYWEIFLKSDLREKMEKTIIWMWTSGKKVFLTVVDFIREVYFE